MLLKLEDLTEAKLSTKQRKRLPESAFCGPDRSYPAHDAAHVRNGLARLAQNWSRYPESTSKKILACLKRKAKTQGVKVSFKRKGEDWQEEGFEEFFKDLFEKSGLNAMPEKEVDELLQREWTQEDKDGVIKAQEEEIAEDKKFLASIPEKNFCGPHRSLPVVSKEWAAVVRTMITWESVKEKLDEDKRADVLGAVDALEAELPEQGFSEEITVPEGVLECDYVLASNLIESTVIDAVEGFKAGESAPDNSGDAIAEAETLEQKLARTEETLKIREKLCTKQAGTIKQLKTEKERLSAEVKTLQEANAKLSSEYQQKLIERIVKLKKQRGATESEKELTERYSKVDASALVHILDDLVSESGHVQPTSAQPAVEVYVDNAGGSGKKDSVTERMKKILGGDKKDTPSDGGKE